jgi:hypothetical protein
MQPLETILRPVMIRVRRETYLSLQQLARSQGLRTGPFLAHVAETLTGCPPDKFHSAMAQFQHESRRP